MKTFLLAVTLVAMPIAMTACTYEDAGYYGLYGGAYEFDDYYDYYDDWPSSDYYGRWGRYDDACRGGWRTYCYNHYDYAGRLRRECDQTWDYCARRDGFYGYGWEPQFRNAAAPTSVANSRPRPKTVETQDALLWGKTFGMSKESSKTLIVAFQRASQGHPESLQRLGLSTKELDRLSHGRMPSDDGIEQLARSLDQSPKAADAMVRKLLKNARKHRN